MNIFKNLSTVTIATMLFTCAFGQTYKLVDDSNKWYEFGEFGGWSYYSEQNVHLYYFFNGDTVINGITYKQLFHNRRDTIYDTPIWLQNSYGYTAAFRQDSLKVYFILKDSTSEKLFCDYDISVGDTLDYFYNYQHNKVTAISSIPFGSNTLTRYELDNGGSFYEGIGASYGLFHDWSIGIEGGVYLACFEQAGITAQVSAFGNPPCQLNGQTIGNCSASYNLFPDTVPHRYFAINTATGTAPLTYRWDWGDGTTDTVPFPSHTYTVARNYTIALTIGDATGCTDTYKDFHSIQKNTSEVIEVNVIPPPVPTGIIESTGNRPLLMFPNPVVDILTVELPGAAAGSHLKIFDMLGQLKFSSTATTQKNNLHVSALARGIYVLEVRTNEGISRQKFMKE